MKRHAGIWIDHRSAFIVSIDEGAEVTERIESGVEKHVRFSGGDASGKGWVDDQQDKKFAGHLDRYYDEVIARLHGAESILLLGPGEAKGEFEKRLSSKGLGGRIVGVETVDKMTDHQIVARVRQHYQE
jgi:stalled ribosome rescue protein Dom34